MDSKRHVNKSYIDNKESKNLKDGDTTDFFLDPFRTVRHMTLDRMPNTPKHKVKTHKMLSILNPPVPNA